MSCHTHTHVFFTKLLWLPRGRRPLRVPLMMPLPMRALSKRIDFCKLHTFSFFGTVPVTIAQAGSPNEFFHTFFGRVFGPARVRMMVMMMMMMMMMMMIMMMMMMMVMMMMMLMMMMMMVTCRFAQGHTKNLLVRYMTTMSAHHGQTFPMRV